ncbi:hypothetical protein [Mesorhizobium australicum]|uniref:Uncharacterized protein n=1 Tax=Mesorhizobium australicum TaxID=536018 RepID=A0A1X7MNQ7_9HYPH|nr:hypothetical protein [Mesorhizobium australicum]SMH26472.1 hypothetical protein SAMN02982922_0267 [Mesorhizobium australicum]
MTEYIVKLRFWLRCWDSMDIEAENDEEAVRIACDTAREMMQLVSFPESIETDERREGLASYIDRIDAEVRSEIAEAIEFQGARRLFPEKDDLIVRLARLRTGDLASEAQLRAFLDDIVAQARRIKPDAPPPPDPAG